jgi:hypothetical protein
MVYQWPKLFCVPGDMDKIIPILVVEVRLQQIYVEAA